MYLLCSLDDWTQESTFNKSLSADFHSAQQDQDHQNIPPRLYQLYIPSNAAKMTKKSSKKCIELRVDLP